MRRGLAIELNVAHACDLVHGKPRMFGVSIDNGLAHRWGQLTFILLEDLGRWNWWQQRGHACLIKQIRFEVERTLGGPGFRGTLFGTDPEKHDRAQDLILNLRWVFK